MRKRTWQTKSPKPPPRPKVVDDVREAVDAQAARVVARLKKRLGKKPKNQHFNYPDDLFTRWHREALYFVVVMRTPHGRPPTFEVHAARMEHAGDGRFNLAVPMRRGWNTIKQQATVDVCLEEIEQTISV